MRHEHTLETELMKEKANPRNFDDWSFSEPQKDNARHKKVQYRLLIGKKGFWANICRLNRKDVEKIDRVLREYNCNDLSIQEYRYTDAPSLEEIKGYAGASKVYAEIITDNFNLDGFERALREIKYRLVDSERIGEGE